MRSITKKQKRMVITNIMIALPNSESNNKLIPPRRKYMKKAMRTDINFLFPISSFPE